MKLVGGAKGGLYRAIAHPRVATRVRHQVSANGITVLMYHDLGADDDDYPVWQLVKESSFRAQMAYLRSVYDIVGLDDAVRQRQSLSSSDRPRAVITFDDGLSGNADYLLPIVRELRLPVTIYVATEHLERQRPAWTDRVVNALQYREPAQLRLERFGLGRVAITGSTDVERWASIQRLLDAIKPMPRPAADDVAAEIEAQAGGSIPALLPLSLQQLADLAAEPLVTLGSHTHGHELLDQLDDDAAAATISRSVELLRSWTGRSIDHFAYPNGSYRPSTVEVVRSLGFASATTVAKGIWRRTDSVFEIPRVHVSRFDSQDRFVAETLGGVRSLPLALRKGSAPKASMVPAPPMAAASRIVPLHGQTFDEPAPREASTA
jgi:peptidoglycan/xylan/chitin deacetylase (PgdA/CDA1 family)